MKIGDRVSYHGKRADWEGFTGTISHIAANGKCRVEFNQIYAPWGANYGTGIPLDSLELIMPKLDTTRPLFIDNGSTQRPAPFITMTSEGHILVGRCEEGCSAWSIYDANGNWVRSEGGGSQTKLVNKPARRVTYQRVTGVGSVGVTVYESLETLKANWNDEYVGAVKVTAEDGKVISVELVR